MVVGVRGCPLTPNPSPALGRGEPMFLEIREAKCCSGV